MTTLNIIIIAAIVLATAIFAIVYDSISGRRKDKITLVAATPQELEKMWHIYMLDGWKIEKEAHVAWSWYHLEYMFMAVIKK